jgi:anti-sigma B factor antagonist
MLKVEDFDLKGTAASAIYIGGTHKDHVMPKGISIPGMPTVPASVIKKGGEQTNNTGQKPTSPAKAIPKAEDQKPSQQAGPSAIPKSRYSVAELTIYERLVENVLILKLEGRLTKGEGTAALRDAIRGSVAEGKKNILLDLKGVNYVEDGALGELISSNTAVETAGGKLRLLDPSEAFQNALMITKFLTVFQTYDNEDEALASF